MRADYPRIRSIHLNRWERPRRATVWTKYGMVKVVWRDVAGDQCWFASGTGDAEREAVPAIEHIEQMCQTMHSTVHRRKSLPARGAGSFYLSAEWPHPWKPTRDEGRCTEGLMNSLKRERILGGVDGPHGSQ